MATIHILITDIYLSRFFHELFFLFSCLAFSCIFQLCGEFINFCSFFTSILFFCFDDLLFYLYFFYELSFKCVCVLDHFFKTLFYLGILFLKKTFLVADMICIKTIGTKAFLASDAKVNFVDLVLFAKTLPQMFKLLLN